MRVRLLVIAIALIASVALPSAQTDLDAFMSQVLARRDDNWAKLQQYILDERETFQLTALEGRRIYGFSRDYNWFPRDGIFVRSPVKADGVLVSDADRRKAEVRWIEKERARAKGDEAADNKSASSGDGNGDSLPSIEDLVTPGNEPGFVSSAYFMKFTFDPGHYALAGRERLLGRDVLKIESYPSALFHEGRERPAKQVRDEDADVEAKMNKTARVTLWVDPATHQILRYEFKNTDLSFLPARWAVRVEGLQASMQMAEPFPGVWLPDTIAMRFRMRLATGEVDAGYDVRYHDYRLATVKATIR